MPVHGVDRQDPSRSSSSSFYNQHRQHQSQTGLRSFRDHCLDANPSTSQQQQQLPPESSSCSSSTCSSPPPQLLPQATYSPSRNLHPNSRLSLNTSGAATNGDAGRQSLRSSVRDEASPDPHEYYLQYRDPFNYDGAGPFDDQGLASNSSHQTAATRTSQVRNGSPSYQRRQARSPSSRSASGTTNTGHSNGRTSPLNSRRVPSAQRLPGSKPGSLQYLVDRFNQNQDEVPPKPSCSSSVSSSRAGSPTPHSRSGNTTTTRPRMTRASSANHPQHFESEPNPAARQSRSTISAGDKHYAHAEQPPPSANFASTGRKPLFGEIIPSDNLAVPQLRVETASHGPPSSSVRQRSGSDGMMHSPGPILAESPVKSPNALSPTSPTAWYLGYPRSLHNGHANTTSLRVSHRRSRSDMTATASPTTPKFGIPKSETSETLTPKSLSSSTTARPNQPSNSQSRIPRATRRPSHTSDSGSSSPSTTRTNSSLDRHPASVPQPPKGVSAIPKRPPNSRSSSQTRNGGSSAKKAPPPARLDVTSPSRSRAQPKNGGPPHAQKSPTLKAYIATPPAKQSPPLRSSRPRQPVSAASTSASRAKVVDRISSINSAPPTAVKPEASRVNRSKSRRIPELGNVDFAARRHQIQQAFNKSVKENNAKREERAVRRRQLAKEKEEHRQEPQTPADDEPPETAVADVPASNYTADQDIPPLARTSTVTTESPELSNDAFVTPEEGLSPRMAGSFPADEKPQNESIAEQTDSPATDEASAGVAAAEPLYIPRTHAADSDATPASAATIKTSTTLFDMEPQSADAAQSRESRTMLNHIMQMRESSPSDGSSDDDEEEEDDEFSSGRDDKESIQIMLRRSGYYPESPTSSDDQDEQGEIDYSQSSGEQQRWSVSSWASSTHDRRRSGGSSLEIPERTQAEEQNKDVPSSQNVEKGMPSPQPLLPTRYDPDGVHQTDSTEAATTVEEQQQQQLPHAQSVRTLLLQQHPDLVKQARWDSKRATQLYMQELAKSGFDSSRFSKSSAEIADSQIEQEVASLQPDGGYDYEQQQQGDDAQELAEDGVESTKDLELPTRAYSRHRASLNNKSDWIEASPSIADWMHIAAGDDDTEEQDFGYAELPADNVPRSPEREGAETPRISSGPGDQTASGLGLSIRVQSPQDDKVQTVYPPPLPNYSPPPPPKEGADERAAGSTATVEISPSIYSTHPLPSSASHPSQQQDYAQGNRSSEESSLRHVGLTPSPQTLASSATSQARSSAEQMASETPASQAAPEQHKLKKRSNVIKELMDTEYTFGQDITVVVDIYKGTSNSCLDLSPEDVKTLFGNIEQIVKFSLDFQDSLKRAAKSVYVLHKSQRWRSKRGSRFVRASNIPAGEGGQAGESEVSDEQKDRETTIGQAFMANIERMEKVYTDYLKNHEAANKKLEALQKSKKVNIWLKECREWASDLTGAWDLDSLLVKPVQRILKYPLLLTELMSATPNNHPDHAALADALRETTSISVRINELKRRADVVGQVVGNRKRKESDVRAGLSKAFGRRTEKLKQHVGLTETFTDKEFDTMAQRFGDNFFQLQLIMRDVELYATEVQNSTNKFNDFVLAIEAYMTVEPSHYPELESKWCRFKLAVKDVLTVALTDHVASLRKSVINPMVTLLKLHDGPQRVMQKRNKRLLDYVKMKAAQDRGDKADKKTKEQGEQFVALNDTLKDELPKLVTLTGKLMEACLSSFVQLQTTWHTAVQKRLRYILDRQPDEIGQIISDWSGDFSFSEAQVLSLGICNGSVLAETGNLHSFHSPPTSNEPRSRRPSTAHSGAPRGFSSESISSPKISFDQGVGNPNSFGQSPPTSMNSTDNHQQSSDAPRLSADGRARANSSFTGRVSTNSEFPSMSSIMNTSTRTSTSTSHAGPSLNSARASEASPSLPQLSLDTPQLHEFLSDPKFLASQRGTAPDPAEHPSSPGLAGRYSGFFSSAMPMPETSAPPTPFASGQQTQEEDTNEPEPEILFLAASLFEFNIDRSRREAGYPYLTYVAGEVFDVIAEKGDLWLARNQDDPTHQIGWIWTEHFTRIGGT